jgi:hypothetical protein
MPLLADRVRETSATTGTGTLTLAGAVAGYQGFNAAFANADTVYYVIQYATEWEVGIGTVGTGTLSRDSVLASSNADALVPFSAGTKDVFVAYVAERAVTTSDAATLTNKTIDSITNLVGADHIHYKIKANATITKGQTLKAVGYNAGEAAIEVVPISSASDIAVGIAYQNLASGAFGAAINTGLLIGVKTDFAGWALGDVLYPDPSTGGLTKTKPTSGTYQACAYVMRVQSNNGVLLCEFTEPQQVLASTNTANTAVLRDGSGNFAAGTVTAALTGNASTATALATARNINGVSFNGSADITVTAAAGTLSGSTLASGVTASSLTSVGTLSSLGVSGNLTVDTDTLFVDAANNRVGVNCTPVVPAQIRTQTNGNVGFQPATVLSGGNKINNFNDAAAVAVGLELDASAHVLLISGTEALRVDASRNLGIGTASPGVRLDVIGVTRTTTSFAVGDSSGNFSGSLVNESDTSKSVTFNADPGNVGASTFMRFNVDGTERARLDASGNLGLGVTPSAWGLAAFQVNKASQWGAGNNAYWGSNYYYDGSVRRYIATETATEYAQNVSGDHRWYTAPSGTAGNAISFVQDMTLTGGQLALGTATASTTLGRNITINGASAGTNTGIILSSASVERGYIYGNDTQVAVGSIASIPTVFTTNNTERARIDASGNLLVGDASATGAVISGYSAAEGIIRIRGGSGSNQGGAFFVSNSAGSGTLAAFGDTARMLGGTVDASVTVFVGSVPLTFYVDGAERGRYKTTGQLRFVPLSADPGGAETGDVYYNSSTNKLRVYNGAWVDLH